MFDKYHIFKDDVIKGYLMNAINKKVQSWGKK